MTTRHPFRGREPLSQRLFKKHRKEMPGFSSKRRVYRKILETEQRKLKDKSSSGGKQGATPVPVVNVKSEILMEEITGQSEIQVESVETMDMPLFVPRSRKLCNWKPNVSTVFEDSTKPDPKKGEPQRPCRLIRSIQEYLAAWFTPKQKQR